MAYTICATCRFYIASGDGTGYWSLKEKNVKHGNSCSEHEVD